MAEPVFSDTTERLYSRLPEAYRTEDSRIDWPMKKWLSGVVDQLGDIDTLIERFRYTPPDDGVPVDTSDLVDPTTADPEWLDWLAQLVGELSEFMPSTTVDQKRAEIASTNKFLHGTKAAMAEAGQTVLTGTKFIEIFDHTSSSAAIGAAGQWDVLIVTKSTETVSSPSTAIIALGAKPAGIQLHEETFTTTWDAMEAAFPTWADWERTWNEIEEAGL